MKKLTVILPAAGKGSRLNLPFPKEIFRINQTTALIDNSFDLFKNYHRDHIEFVVIINEEKTDIVKYLSKYNTKFNISFTYQNPNEPEVTGAIKSAYHLFSDQNIVLLPDTILTLPKKMDLKVEVERQLTTKEFTFLFKREDDFNILKSRGCIKLDAHDRVINYVDKPRTAEVDFDGYWCGFGFRKSSFFNFIKLIEHSTLKRVGNAPDIKNTVIFESSITEIEDYKDLGTWEELGGLLSNNKKR